MANLSEQLLAILDRAWEGRPEPDDPRPIEEKQTLPDIFAAHPAQERLGVLGVCMDFPTSPDSPIDRLDRYWRDWQALQYGWDELKDKAAPPSVLKRSPNAKVWKGTPPDKGRRYQVREPGTGRGEAAESEPAPPAPKKGKPKVKDVVKMLKQDLVQGKLFDDTIDAMKGLTGDQLSLLRHHLGLGPPRRKGESVADFRARLQEAARVEAEGEEEIAEDTVEDDTLDLDDVRRLEEEPEEEPNEAEKPPAPPDPYAGCKVNSAGDLIRDGKNIGPRPGLKKPGDPYAGTSHAADEPAVWEALRRAERIERRKVATLEASNVKVPDLYDHIREEIPSLTSEQFHGLLWKWQKEDKLSTQAVIQPHVEPRAAEMPRIPGPEDEPGYGHVRGYVYLRDEHTLPDAPAPKPAPKDAEPKVEDGKHETLTESKQRAEEWFEKEMEKPKRGGNWMTTPRKLEPHPPEFISTAHRTIADWQKDHPSRPMSLRQMYEDVAGPAGLSIPQFHSALLDMHKRGLVRLSEWTQSQNELEKSGDVPYILPFDKEIRNYVELKPEAMKNVPLAPKPK